MNFGLNHAPGAGLIAQPVDQQSSATTVPLMLSTEEEENVSALYTTDHTVQLILFIYFIFYTWYNVTITSQNISYTYTNNNT